MESVGGYRLVRKLGDGERAEVYLGHAGGGESTEPQRMAAVKIFRPTTPLASIDEEIEALARASSRHLIELRDLSTGADSRPCLIFERHDADPLSRLFGQRARIEAGEVVTALAPIASALAELHRVGVAHGNVRLSAVLLDRHGAPILSSFGRAKIFAEFPGDGASAVTPAAFANEPLVLADLRDLIELVRVVLERVPADPALALDRVRGELQQLDVRERPHLLAARLADSLYSLAVALPIEQRPTGAGAAQSPPSATEVTAFGSRGNRAPAATPGEQELTDQGAALIVRPAVEPQEGVRMLVRRWLSRAHAIIASVRRSFWVVGAFGTAAIVAAIVMVPTASRSEPRTPAPTAPVPTMLSSTRGAPEPSATASTPAVAASTDPLSAAKLLLIAREGCLTEKSISCLDEVDQKDSAAMDIDRQEIRRASTGQKTPPELVANGILTLVQQLGDSAILNLASPEGAPESAQASLLIVRSEAGWRIRDLVLP